MNEQQQWPERGQMSDDGKYYTHTDGFVYHRVPRDKDSFCGKCVWSRERKNCMACANPIANGCAWEVVEGPYVPSADQRVAETAMRAHIIVCAGWTGVPCDGGGDADIQCDMFKNRTCHLRRYLADVIRDPKAWEV